MELRPAERHMQFRRVLCAFAHALAVGAFVLSYRGHPERETFDAFDGTMYDARLVLRPWVDSSQSDGLIFVTSPTDIFPSKGMWFGLPTVAVGVMKIHYTGFYCFAQ